jgi:hypothetical protein
MAFADGDSSPNLRGLPAGESREDAHGFSANENPAASQDIHRLD